MREIIFVRDRNGTSAIYHTKDVGKERREILILLFFTLDLMCCNEVTNMPLFIGV